MSAHDHVFGVHHRIHPVTKMPLENGVGHLSDHEQALQHIAYIEEKDGKDVADKLREKLKELAEVPKIMQDLGGPAAIAEAEAFED